MWLVLALLLITTVIFYLKRNYSYWTRHKIPGPDPTWIVGNIGACFKMSKHFGQLVDQWYNKYADVPYFGYYKCLSPAICIRDPNLVKEVLISDFHSFSKNDFGFDEDADPLLKYNPFLNNGDSWKASRSIVAPLFTANKIKILHPLMSRACDRLKLYIKNLGSEYDFNAKELAGKFTADNVAMVGFSLDGESFSNPNSEFLGNALKIFKPTIRQSIQFMIIIFLPSLVKLFKLRFMSRDIDAWIRKLVKQNIESRKLAKFSCNDLLQMMLDQQIKSNLADEQLAGQSLAFIAEGTGAPSTLLANIMYELARNPDVQQRLYEEITDVLSQHNNEISYDLVQQITYLEEIAYEVLRINPIFMTIQKVCTKEYKLPPLPGQTEGFIIPKGMTAQIPVNSLHLDGQYFPNPNVFDPSRHCEEQAKCRPKCCFLPFGDGPRMCMGLRFALVQTKTAMVHIIQSYKIKLSPNCKPFVLNPANMLCTPIDPLLLNFEPRDPL